MRTIPFTMAVAASLILFSCQKEPLVPETETGTLRIDVGLYIQVEDLPGSVADLGEPDLLQGEAALNSPQPLNSENSLNTGQFKVVISRTDGTEVISFPTVAEMPDTIELATGDYLVEAHSDNDLPAEFENPYYYGISDTVTITGNSQQSVLVSCRLANTIVTVAYSDQVTSSFTDYVTTVASSAGFLEFGKTETRRGYFRPLPLDINVSLTYLKPDGTSAGKTISGSIPDPMPNKQYDIQVDASIDEGMASFQVVLEEETVLVEIVQLSDSAENVPAGAIGPGELLITEIMCDPSALSDTEGEWFEIHNLSQREIDLTGLVLGRDDLNRHTVTDTLMIPAGGYAVFQRTEGATNAPLRYVYGSGILLPNSGAVLSLFNPETGAGPGELIFSVNYGETGFPGTSGAAISLSPDAMSPSDALLGSNWCPAVTAYGTGDLGTPGTVNDPCN